MTPSARPSIAAILLAAPSQVEALATLRASHPDASRFEIARAMLTTREVLKAAGLPVGRHWLTSDG